jgi:hypothetical protein
MSSERADVIFLICTERAADEEYNELRFALRSLDHNLREPGRVFIVGTQPPAWLRLDRVVHLPVEDLPSPPLWKDYNLIRKVNAVCHGGCSPRAIVWMDDQFLLRPTRAGQFWPRAETDFSTWTRQRWDKAVRQRGKGGYFRRLRNTAEALLTRGMTAHMFDTHHPVLIDTSSFPNVMRDFCVDAFGVSGEDGFTINTLYFNAMGAPARHATDALCHPSALPGPRTRFWNVNEHFDWPTALDLLESRFPAPSRFERPEAIAEPQPFW